MTVTAITVEQLDDIENCLRSKNLTPQAIGHTTGDWIGEWNDALQACAAVRKNLTGDPYVLVEGGLVQNDPALPVLDLDFLDSVDSPFDDEAILAYDLARRFNLADTMKRIKECAHEFDIDLDDNNDSK